jgi:hypothetical protein
MAQTNVANLANTPGPHAELIASLNTFDSNMQNKLPLRNHRKTSQTEHAREVGTSEL